MEEVLFSVEDEMTTVTESAGVSGESVDAADHELVPNKVQCCKAKFFKQESNNLIMVWIN